jgi:hypothetical protein
MRTSNQRHADCSTWDEQHGSGSPTVEQREHRTSDRSHLAVSNRCIIIGVIVGVKSGERGASYTASAEFISPIDPSDVNVQINVTNTSAKAGRPACTV